MTVLSLGLGVQSSTIYLMACEGEVEIESAVFADPQWESQRTYDWLAQLQQKPIPIHHITRGNIREDALSGHGRFASMPLYQKNADGSRGIARRQCTNEYKVAPIQRLLRSWGATHRNPVDLAIGISLEEVHRARDSRVKYIRHVFPLLDRRMTRADCLVWLEKHGYPAPAKSACVGCPFRRNPAWRDLTPAEWADAIDFDKRIRHDPKGYWRGERFLHDSLVPLEMADIRSEQDRGQMDMFMSDGCGVLCSGDVA